MGAARAGIYWRSSRCLDDPEAKGFKSSRSLAMNPRPNLVRASSTCRMARSNKGNFPIKVVVRPDRRLLSADVRCIGITSKIVTHVWKKLPYLVSSLEALSPAAPWRDTAFRNGERAEVIKVPVLSTAPERSRFLRRRYLCMPSSAGCQEQACFKTKVALKASREIFQIRRYTLALPTARSTQSMSSRRLRDRMRCGDRRRKLSTRMSRSSV